MWHLKGLTVNIFSITACILAAAGTSASMAVADDIRENVPTCLQDNIVVTPMNFSKEAIDERAITARIRN